MTCGFLIQLVFCIKVCLRHQSVTPFLFVAPLLRNILHHPLTVPRQTAPKSGQNKSLETARICSKSSARIKVQLSTFTPSSLQFQCMFNSFNSIKKLSARFGSEPNFFQVYPLQIWRKIILASCRVTQAPSHNFRVTYCMQA